MITEMIENINVLAKVNALGLPKSVVKNVRPDSFHLLDTISPDSGIGQYYHLALYLLKNNKVYEVLTGSSDELKNAYNTFLSISVPLDEILQFSSEQILTVSKAYKDICSICNQYSNHYYYNSDYCKEILVHVLKNNKYAEFAPEELYNLMYGMAVLKTYAYCNILSKGNLESWEPLLKTCLVKPYEKDLEKLYKKTVSKPGMWQLLEYLYSNGIQAKTYSADNPEEILSVVKEIISSCNGSNNEENIKNALTLAFSKKALIKEMKCLHYKLSHGTIGTLNEYEDYIRYIYCDQYSEFFNSETILDEFGEMGSRKQDLILYALRNNKRAFLKLAMENWDLLLNMGYDNILFAPSFRKCINLNTLNSDNLKKQHKIYSQEVTFIDELPEGMILTFDELAYLMVHGTPLRRKVYFRLNMRVDDKLRVIKELPIFSVASLDLDISEDEVTDRLVSLLNQKPLSKWFSEEGKNIKKCNYTTYLKYFMFYDKFRVYHGQVKDAVDINFLLKLKNSSLLNFKDLDVVKKYFYASDDTIAAFKKDMDLSEDFVEKHENNIFNFAGRGLMEVYNKLKEAISDSQAKNLKLITKAYLAGQYRKIKFYGQDLDLEIGMAVSDTIRDSWAQDLSSNIKGFNVTETSDYETTIQIGELPKSTCLSWKDGIYRTSLLSCFDQNKKFMVAYNNSGDIVARAMLRLTKGCDKVINTKKLKFRDIEEVENQSDNPSEGGSNERLVLFLERFYVERCSPEEEKRISEAFVKVAQQKAVELGAILAISTDYAKVLPKEAVRKHYSIFISYSRNGIQYLDSLGGSNKESSEGTYKSADIFIVE